MGPGRSSSLHIGDDSSAVSGSKRTGGASDSSTEVVLRDAPGEPHFPLDKGKGKIDEIKYPERSEYLVTPRSDEVHSICNCRGAYVHQVPL